MVMHALVSGLVLSVVIIALLLIVLRANPEIVLNDYPPDVKAKWGPMSARTKRQRVVAAAVLCVAGIAIVAWSLQTWPAFVARDMTFESLFVYFALMFGTFNVLDCVVLDFALVYFQPRFAILPGTEGMAGYRSYWFHVRGFLIGIPIVLVISAVGAAVVMYLR